MTSNTSGKKNHRIPYIDIIRILSCILVVCGHVTAQQWNEVSVRSSQWQTMNVYDCIAVLSVPLFYMISGAVFLNENYKLTIKQLYLKKILRVVVAYHAWLLFYNCLPFFRGEVAFTFAGIKEHLLYKTLTGTGIYHLWFLPELILLYVLSPILKEAFRKKETCFYFTVLFAIIGGFFPLILSYDFPYRVFVESYYNRTSRTMLTGYIGYFVLGHYLHSFITEKLSRKKLYISAFVAIISMIIVIIGCSLDAIATDAPSVLLNTPLSLPQILTCIAIFLCIKNYYHKLPERFVATICNLSKYTMGIYLLHPLVIRVLVDLGASTLFLHPIIMIPVLTLIVFLITLLLVRILHMIPVINKWLL